MASDRQLGANFWLREFTGWQRATETQVARLQETVARVLQPIRSTFGVRVIPTSWIAWSSGELRTGTHADGGAVDFVLEDGLTDDAFEWGAQHLVPAGYIGRWIYEPARAAAPGVARQGEHIHMAPRRAQIAHQGRAEGSAIQVLEERGEGEYFLHFEVTPLTVGAVLALGAGVAFLLTLARRRESFAL